MGAAMTFSTPSATSMRNEDVRNKAAGITGDPYERGVNERIAARDDQAMQGVGAWIFGICFVICAPGVALLIGSGQRPDSPYPHSQLR